jgi:NhaP-type Na+/H+ or K+/H+ antiporter
VANRDWGHILHHFFMRGVTPLFVAFSTASAQARAYVGHPGFWHDGWGWWQVIFAVLTMIVLVSVIVAGAVRIVGWPGGG